MIHRQWQDLLGAVYEESDLSMCLFDGNDAISFYLMITQHFRSEFYYNMHQDAPDWAIMDISDLSTESLSGSNTDSTDRDDQ